MTTTDKLADALRSMYATLADIRSSAPLSPRLMAQVDKRISEVREALAAHTASLAAPPAQGEKCQHCEGSGMLMIGDAQGLCWCTAGDAEREARGLPPNAPQPAPAPVQVDEDCGCYTETTWADGFEAIEQVQCAKHAQPPAPGEAELPPLPATEHFDPGYTARQMHAYARAAIAALAQQRGSDAVWAAVTRLKDRTFPNHKCPAESAAVWNVALYELERGLATIDQQQEARK